MAAPAAAGARSAAEGILREGRLGGIEPGSLVARFGSPLYVYDLDVITERVTMLRSVLPAPVEVAYAVKANPALAVVAHLGSLGLGADIASAGELSTVLTAGLVPDRILFTGPAKRDDELARAVAAGVRAITVESPGELERLERLAADAGRTVPVLLRAASTGAVPHAGLRLVGEGGTGKFGMDASDLRAAASQAAASTHLELLGFHAFGASNVLDADALADHAAATVALARDVAAAVGARLRLVDVGGGLGIPYADDEASLDLAAFGARFHELAVSWAADPVTRSMRVLLEPGRFLVGPAGAYLTRVIDRKVVGGRTIVLVDGGIHHLLRPALVSRPHRVRRVGGPASPDVVASAIPDEIATATGPGGTSASPAIGGVPADPAGDRPVTIAGPLCTGLDVFVSDATMRPPAIGDLLAILDAGAYGLTESMITFLSHPIPAEVAIRDGRAECIRPRQEPESWLATQRIPDW